jgi:hypothetical protein
MQNPDYPVTGQQGQQMTAPMGAVPQSSAWRDIKMTGQAATDYKSLLGAQPGSYQSQYQPMLQQTVQSMMGRQPFRYDVNIDPLYQQLKDNYIKQGRQAMMDTQGQSAALTGGYGNTYGAQAGQQAYQDSLGQLSGQIPQLYQLALERYRGDEQSDLAKAQALQGLDDSQYQRFQYDDQRFQQQLADAYQKMKAASGGGSGKKKDPRTDAEWLIGLSDSAGYDVDASTDALAGQLNWTPEYTAAVKTIVHQYTDYQKGQQAREQEDTDNAGILDIFDSLTKKPK